MKKFLAILILVFTLQTPSQADDIRDFQIEGMSVGDSLLDYFSENEIKEQISPTSFTSKKYIKVFFDKNDDADFLKNYIAIAFYIKADDKKYRIASINAMNVYKEIEYCHKDKDKIFKEVSSLFEDTTISDNIVQDHPMDEESKTSTIYFSFKSGASAKIGCADFSKKMEDKGKLDHLRITLDDSNYYNWLKNEAHK